MISLRRAPESWQRVSATLWYVPLALLLLITSFVPAFHSHGTQLGGLPARPFDALAVVGVSLQCLPLAARRRWPVVCLTLVSAGFAVDQLRGYHSLGGTALPLALMSVSSLHERHRRATVLLFSAAFVALSVALFLLGGTEGLGGYVTFYVALAFAWGIGAWLRSSRAAETERRRRVAEDTRTAERTRIARELHDVVTHHVTAMVVQAEAARYLTASPDRLDQTLTNITGTGREAITDLRHLLDLLNPDHGVEPGAPPAGGLLALVEQTRRAGQPVDFTEKGTPAEPTGEAGLVAHRVVREALTNALKYAHGSRTSVQVLHGEKEITVEVGTDASDAKDMSRDVSPGGSGRGLAGLRQRVDDLGGDFSADRRPGGDFVVRARIPAGSSS